jgi:hypothetical protein
MTHRSAPLLVLVLLLGGCTVTRTDGTPPAAATPPATATSAAGTPTEPSGPPDETPPAAGSYRVVSDWSTRPVTVSHPLVAPPLRFLTEVRFGDHPGDDPAYSRVTFAFEEGLPSYEVRYVASLEQEGSGDPVPVPGNAVLRIVFRDATGYDDAGRETDRPGGTVGYPTLRGYGFGGDFEGHMTFGLGIQVAAGSDQTLPVRVGESVRPDGLHVLAVDVRR